MFSTLSWREIIIFPTSDLSSAIALNSVKSKNLSLGKSWLVVLGFNATLTAKVISWWSVTHMCFPGFLDHTSTNTTFFPKPETTFLTCFCRGERQKYAGKKSRLNQGSNSQPPGHESNTLTTEPTGQELYVKS